MASAYGTTGLARHESFRESFATYCWNMRIVGWAYDADIHCNGCAFDAFGSALKNPGVTDSEGNEVTPIFTTSSDADDWPCGTCRDIVN